MFCYHNIFKVIVCIFGIFTLNTFSYSAFAKSEFTIAVEDTEYLPIHSAKDGVFSGYVIDVLNEFAKQNKYKFKFIALPVKRLIVDYLKKDSYIDFKYPDNDAWDVESKAKLPITYSESLFETREGLNVLPKNKNNKNIDNIKSIGTGLGFSIEEPYDSLVKSKKINLQEVSNLSRLIKMGLANRIDGVYLDEAICEYILENEVKRKNGLVFNADLPFIINKFKLSGLKSEEHSNLISKLNDFLSNSKPLLNKLRKKYGIKPL